MTLSIRTDRRLLTTAAENTRYLLASFKAQETHQRTERLPVNVAFVLDRSGSMSSHNKFDLARAAVSRALTMLRPDDRFALVVYDEVVDLLIDSTPATAEAKQDATNALRGIAARGSTDLCAGWMRGCERIATYLSTESVSRALLLTDGLANRGTTNPGLLTIHANQLRRRGIATSTFGVGADFDELLLRDMAHEGGGHFYYIETPTQIPDLIASELGEALDVVAREVTINFAIPRGATAQPLNRFRHMFDRDANSLRVDLGDIVSGQDVRVLIELKLPQGMLGEHLYADASLTGTGLEPSRASIHWTYSTDAEVESQSADVDVDRDVALLYAARARAEATEANRRGDFIEAQRVLFSASSRIKDIRSDDQVLDRASAMLVEDIPEFSTQMHPSQIKRAFARANAAALRRSPEGKAQRQEETKP
jgi:Ca-activated chloride channel family protein